ncbi:MAG: SIMPL domain-containing protein [Burkholderiales bacterium]
MRHAFLVSFRAAAFAAVAALAPSSGFAQNLEPRFNQVDLQADASREVQNDLMTAIVFVESSDANPTTLGATLAKTLNDALKVAQQSPATKTRSGANQTYPQSDRAGKITSWRGRAELRLEGKDFREIGALVGRLQATMQLAGIGFAVSPELRRQTENELIGEAIAAFRARGELVRQAIGGRAVKVRRMSVNASGGPGPRPMMAQRGAEMSMSSAAPAPQFEGGTSQVQITVAGTVEIE